MSDDIGDGGKGGGDDEAPRRGRVRWGRILLVLLVLGGGPLVYFRHALLRRLPPLLVARDEPKAADALVVLAGDDKGLRVEYACELWKRGLVAKGPFVVAGGRLYQRLTWAEVMRDHAMRNGVPEARIVLQKQSLTTEDDARLTLPELQRRGVKTVLVVTSPWHSARAAKAFRQHAQPLGIEVLSCPSRDEPPEAWWDDPVATRTLVTELLKWVY